ncbi:MAG TPA: D-alanyl-D-alanine carboxypeptidase [Candidatus Nanopelagicaceae bacterium]|nr:D-alanyl-D-alanine carboxypeptidase [Candidatus Nanopelagicaceae bacterium]
MLLKSPDLGGHVGIAIGDVLTGLIIFQASPKAPKDRFIPASSIKLFTAAAVLLTNSPDISVTFKRDRMSLSRLIETTLTESDNDGADLLSTFVPGSSAQVLSANFPDLDLSQSTLSDASGLSRLDRTTPTTLVHLLLILANPANPEFAPILSGLPIAGLTGTLKLRAKAVSGQFRAKTGTLTGVDVLSGYVVDSANRLLAFAVMADQVPETEFARAKLDEIAGALVKLS